MNRFIRSFALRIPVGRFTRDTSWLQTMEQALPSKPEFIGQGFINNHPDYALTHSIIKNPKWHSAYAAYQAEISQGRLTMFNHYQNLIKWLTGKSCTNASSLDDCQAAVDAVNMFKAKNRIKQVSLNLNDLYPYRQEAMKYYADGLGWQVAHNGEGNVTLAQSISAATGNINVGECDVLFFDPKAGLTSNYSQMHAPITVGHLQNFGIPLSAGGPYLGFISADHEYLRYIPGKMVIPAETCHGEPVYRLGLQTREQHIRRDKAMSNICTNQSLMAVYATAWTAFRGIPQITADFNTVTQLTRDTIETMLKQGYDVITSPEQCFDTIVWNDDGRNSMTIDWTHTPEDVQEHLSLVSIPASRGAPSESSRRPPQFFQDAKTELDLVRYMHGLAEKDITLVDEMIPLGSCTMKYNPMHIFRVFDCPKLLATHPLSDNMQHVAPTMEQFKGILRSLTGFDQCSLSPLSGSHGELISLIAIKKYHEARGDQRKTMLLPKSCHGTNAASCKMAGFKIKIVDDLQLATKDATFTDVVKQAIDDSDDIAGIMVTFPNTLGYFDDDIPETLKLVTDSGGLCYMDGANLNSMVGHLNLQQIGFHIGHLNLHKTFAVPHGGGGPGAGPILYQDLLSPHVTEHHGVSQYGNTLANMMSMLYLTEMNQEEVLDIAVRATSNANYLKDLLKDHFDIITDPHGDVSHELVIRTGDINAMDFCKRLIDFGYHPPTVNWPINNCLMIEPTETESQETIKTFADVMIQIQAEDKDVLKSAPTNPRYTRKIDEVASDRDINESRPRQK